MRLTLPEGYREGFAALIGYAPATLAKLEAAIAASSPSLAWWEFSGSVADTAGLDPDELEEVLRAVGSLVNLREQLELSASELCDELQGAMRETGEERLDPARANWSVVAKFLTEVIRPEGPLAVTAKATILSRQQDREYCTSKVYSDLRPIFDAQAQKPLAVIGLHHLRITYHKPSFETDVFSVTLTRSQLLELKSVIERAIVKDRQLAQISKAASLSFLQEQEAEETDGSG